MAGDAAMMNLDLCDIANTPCLAREPWMMTCTDGRSPSPTPTFMHPSPSASTGPASCAGSTGEPT